jgi:hypothetical protein
VFCQAFTHIANWICTAWNYLTKVVCIFVDIVTGVVNAILGVAEVLIGTILRIVANAVSLVFSIPVVGPILNAAWNAAKEAFWTVASIPDAILGFVGILPEKRLRICAGDAELPPEMRDRFERRLNTLYNDCGCTAGAIFLLLGMAASATWIILAGRFTFRDTGLGFLFAIALSLVGKLAGLTISSWRLDRIIRELRQVWRTQEVKTPAYRVQAGEN